MAESRKVRVGFIGAGQISVLHALAYRDNPTGELYAVADIDPALAEQRSREWGARKWFTDYRDLLADPKVEAVEIILPHHLHLPATVAALEAGMHVSLQKPVAVSLEDADAISAAAENSHRRFRVFENFRSYEPFRLARALIDQGEIGEPLSIRMKVVSGRGVGGWTHTPEARAWRVDASKSGGWLSILDHGYHLTSIAMYFMGPVERVHTMGGGQERETPDPSSGRPTMITFQFAQGEKYGSWEIIRAPDLLVKTSYYGSDEWVEITGTRGIVWINRCSGDLLGIPPVTLCRDGELRHFHHVDTDWGDSFRRGGAEFTDAIVNGGELELTAAEARGALAFSLAAIRSAKERREVSVGELEESLA